MAERAVPGAESGERAAASPPPAAANCVFGSDTCSVEMRCGDHVLIFDAGSGAVSLSRRLVAEGIKDFDLFFSHCHFDHIMGLPFLKPLYDHEVDGAHLCRALRGRHDLPADGGRLHGAALFPGDAEILRRRDRLSWTSARPRR